MMGLDELFASLQMKFSHLLETYQIPCYLKIDAWSNYDPTNIFWLEVWLLLLTKRSSHPKKIPIGNDIQGSDK